MTIGDAARIATAPDISLRLEKVSTDVDAAMMGSTEDETLKAMRAKLIDAGDLSVPLSVLSVFGSPGDPNS